MKKIISIAAVLIILVLGFLGISFLGNTPVPSEISSREGETIGNPIIQKEESKFVRGVKRILTPILKEDPKEPLPNLSSETNLNEDPSQQNENNEVIVLESKIVGGAKIIGGEIPEELLPPSVVIEEIAESGVFESEDLRGYTPIQYEPDKYETTAKQQAGYISLDFKDEDGVVQIGVLNTLSLSDEDLFYVLSAYSDYFENGENLEKINFKYEVEDFEGRYENVDEGMILVSDEKIFVIMAESQTSLDSLLKTFNEKNPTNGTLINYLEQKSEKLEKISDALSAQKQKIKSYDQKVPQYIKDFGLKLWDAYLVLDTNELQQYYAEKVWFYADPDEWFSDNPNKAEYTEKKFYLLDREELLASYKRIKAEEFAEQLSMLKELRDEITFYYAEDLMELCNGEDKAEFYDYLKIQEGDVVMFVQRATGSKDICTLNGKFNFVEKLFWLLRQVDGKVQVVTDFNE